ncbi:hypothetical protein OS242_10690 [Tumebacillus sp. DT12]|uniref:Uncharacterized protein n=1 Tax=Tumebacillus lacus TaxID=2995335 RepID=A0ABT3X4C1_9BACL|nr:hypothetical protein [Tumebacillus lacus]MCX7570430.1 hypothetical protein [Tumebacillus lacus]
MFPNLSKAISIIEQITREFNDINEDRDGLLKRATEMSAYHKVINNLRSGLEFDKILERSYLTYSMNGMLLPEDMRIRERSYFEVVGTLLSQSGDETINELWLLKDGTFIETELKQGEDWMKREITQRNVEPFGVWSMHKILQTVIPIMEKKCKYLQWQLDTQRNQVNYAKGRLDELLEGEQRGEDQ